MQQYKQQHQRWRRRMGR